MTTVRKNVLENGFDSENIKKHNNAKLHSFKHVLDIATVDKSEEPKGLWCVVCGMMGQYKFYGVQSCEGCKQFFRRTIVNQREFCCWKECDTVKGQRCRSCRLDKCLLEGMEPTMVTVPARTDKSKQFIARMKQRQHRLRHMDYEASTDGQQQSPKSPNEALDQQVPFAPEVPVLRLVPNPDQLEDNQLVDYLLSLEELRFKIWQSDMEIPPEYTAKFDSLESLLEYKGNILAAAEKFEEPMEFWGKMHFVAHIAKYGFDFTEILNILAKDRLLCAEMAKAMPFFHKLNVQDQKKLVCHVAGPVAMCFNAFYSAKIGAQSWTRPNGMMYLPMIDQKCFADDQTIAYLAKLLLVDNVESFRQANISSKEFVLLLAVIYASSAAPELSQYGRELLYEESVRYSRLLLRVVQHRYGAARGALQYAAILQLVNVAFKHEYHSKLLVIRLELFYALKKVSMNNLPKILTWLFY